MKNYDKTKQPIGCNETTASCKNLKETSNYADMDGETYECDVCGLRFRLYYDDMR